MRTLIRSVFLVVSYRAATSRAIFAADVADLNHETGTNAALPSGGKPRSEDDIVALIGWRIGTRCRLTKSVEAAMSLNSIRRTPATELPF